MWRHWWDTRYNALHGLHLCKQCQALILIFVFDTVQGSVQCLQFDKYKIVSGSWDTSIIVSWCYHLVSNNIFTYSTIDSPVYRGVQFSCIGTLRLQHLHVWTCYFVGLKPWKLDPSKFPAIWYEIIFICNALPLHKVWDVVHFTALNVLNGHVDCVSCLQFDEEKLYACYILNTIKKMWW